ncbi:tyrosine-type recombinase/integrase [Streptomyces sp. NPDC006739]|uniref:tyrosine-type recombinase/integrase n=1 Tax=Streptomyces sp. NPDC006739 TaxID=3364763 RepID=UPI0036C177A8
MSQHAIPESSLLSLGQVRSLLEWVRNETDEQSAEYPLFVSMATAALLPGEAIRLRFDDVTLSDDGFGELLIRGAERRRVPVAPELVRVLRAWIGTAALKTGDPLFPGERGGPLASSVYRRVWKQAREEVLRPDEVAAGLGEHVASLRDSCLESWLKAGVPAWGVAEWSGVTASWLAVRYPHCFRLEDVELDWAHLTEVMALPDELKS